MTKTIEDMSTIPIYNYSYSYQNRENFPTQQKLVGLHNGYSLCSLWGRNWIIIHEYGR